MSNLFWAVNQNEDIKKVDKKDIALLKVQKTYVWSTGSSFKSNNFERIKQDFWGSTIYWRLLFELKKKLAKLQKKVEKKIFSP